MKIGIGEEINKWRRHIGVIEEIQWRAGGGALAKMK